jgi:hypothetical protein
MSFHYDRVEVRHSFSNLTIASATARRPTPAVLAVLVRAAKYFAPHRSLPRQWD